MAAASSGKLSKSSIHMDTSSSCHVLPTDLAKKRTRSEFEQNCGRYFEEDQMREASNASASFCKDTDTTMMIRASFEPPQSFKSKRNGEEDSGFHTCSVRNLFSFVGRTRTKLGASFGYSVLHLHNLQNFSFIFLESSTVQSYYFSLPNLHFSHANSTLIGRHRNRLGESL
ncbi:unnamed protein product [Fraxinus pennsylvanica]|uniref:Uncharacterized protein n=1 Tax=Fraxinus pennsylvanica TaxID=56036 RepID=A0AAD2DUC8_9LAMI|nr:unnamed protein product [Fraxinus pennsylvanica]